MWIRWDDRLIPVKNAWVFRNAESATVFVRGAPLNFDSEEEAQAALDRIHKWLDGLGAVLQHDPTGYPSHISTNFVLDLRKEAPDETD